MDDLLNKIKKCYVNDDGDKWTYTEELLAEHCETLKAENARLRAERDTLRADVDAAIAGHLDYSFCDKCDDMRYFEVTTHDGNVAFRCRICGQTEATAQPEEVGA